MKEKNFISDSITYASRIKQFHFIDWLNYGAWIGLMLSLFIITGGFILVGHYNGVEFPPYVWNIPIGTFIFVVSIAIDTIGHRTIYKEELSKGEALVHHITIFSGVSSCILLSLAYSFRAFLEIPAFVMIALSIFYSVIDEALHWRRYINGLSDRVEMWSHFFIFVGHLLMILSWWRWFQSGYVGVSNTLLYLQPF